MYGAGPGKSVVLVDGQGNEEVFEFRNRRDFEAWTTTNTLKLRSTDGKIKSIRKWELLQDGGNYYTSHTLEKTVSGVNSCGAMVLLLCR